jgi:hypothetical protein
VNFLPNLKVTGQFIKIIRGGFQIFNTLSVVSPLENDLGNSA